MKHRIATIGSHSALQILKGAKDEGFETIAICKKGHERPYRLFGVADEIITLDSLSEIPGIQDRLNEKNAILIPHGTFPGVLSQKAIEDLKVPYFGNRKILRWEYDREMQRDWLKRSRLTLPQIFKTPEDIDKPSIVKFYGAFGGKGFFLAKNSEEFNQKIKYKKGKAHIIQEYIIGSPIYIHYFYSPITDELELMSFDKRYESNVDSIGRIAAKDQLDMGLETSYNITGNVPLVVRESLLPDILRMGERVVKSSRHLEEKGSPGLFGPFSLETVITPDLKFYVFEISARIVAGTNFFINSSPYADLKYNEPMSTGRRIAREIKIAEEKEMLDKVLL